mgnify:CR=1 FL=1
MGGAQPVVVVRPEGHEEVSGGNLYNRHLLQALADCGELRRLSVAQWTEATQEPGIYLIDSLNLVEFVSMYPRRVEGQHFVLLVHHLPSLEPGLVPHDASLQIEREALARFDAFVATSEYTQSYLASLGYQQRVHCLPPPPPSFSSVPRPLTQPLHALMACNLVPRKGVLEFLLALAEELEASDSLVIDIVGRTDLEPAYARACAECIAASEQLRTRVRLQGASAYSEMPAWYQRANLFVSASAMETYGISLQEAKHFGLPIFAMIGGNSANHVAAGITGELYPSPAELAKAVVGLSRSPSSLAEYFRQAQLCRETTGSSWPAEAQRLRLSLEAWFPS